MKILSAMPWNHDGRRLRSVIVEMSGDELEKICGDLPNDGWNRNIGDLAGRTVEISKRFCHVTKIEREVKEAKKLPSQLRTLADALELAHPAMELLIEEQLPPKSD